MIELNEQQQNAIDASLADIGEFAIAWLIKQGVRPAEDGTIAVANIWREIDPVGPEETEAFYSRDDVSQAMVVKLSRWHGTDPNVRKQNASILAHAKPGRVLDFGAGIGTLAIALALAGNEVECIELGPWQREFALARAEALGAKITFVDKPTGKYDTIAAMDVIEHLPQPAEFADLAWRHMHDDSVLACNWVFFCDDNNPQHVQESTPRARAWHHRRTYLFSKPLASAAVTSNGWPSVHTRKPIEEIGLGADRAVALISRLEQAERERDEAIASADELADAATATGRVRKRVEAERDCLREDLEAARALLGEEPEKRHRDLKGALRWMLLTAQYGPNADIDWPPGWNEGEDEEADYLRCCELAELVPVTLKPQD